MRRLGSNLRIRTFGYFERYRQDAPFTLQGIRRAFLGMLRKRLFTTTYKEVEVYLQDTDPRIRCNLSHFATGPRAGDYLNVKWDGNVVVFNPASLTPPYSVHPRGCCCCCSCLCSTGATGRLAVKKRRVRRRGIEGLVRVYSVRTT
jgi:hypothetical protein